MLITIKRDIRPPTAPVLGSPVVLGTTSIQIPLATAASDVNGIASYTLEYSTTLNGTYVAATTAAIFPQTVTGLTPSTQYFFRAYAVDNFGNIGPTSGIVTATTQIPVPTDELSWPVHVPGYVSLIPGVGGYGMNSVAGSGRNLATPATSIILVNSLAAGNTGSAVTGYGPNVYAGTWEYAWRHNATPKVIIPIISGWVTVQDSVPLQTGTPPRPGYVSYFGQFAPGQGLYLRGANVEINGASNVAIWHLRSYMGDDVTGLGAGNRDCLSSGYATGVSQQIALINCEFAWSVDEIAGFFRSHDQVSCTGCAFIEPLHISTIVHPEDGPGVDHGFGPMFGGDTGQPQSSSISCFRNLWAHTTARNPFVSSVSFVHANNLHYNHGRPTGGQGNAVQITATGSAEANFANILGNAFIRGPNNNASLVAVTATGSFPSGSAAYLFGNAQFGWTAPANQNAFLTSAPVGYAAAVVQAPAYPNSWGTGLTGVLQWAVNPLAPTLTEWGNFVTLMDSTVGAQPIRRTTGRVKLVFDQIRDRLAGVTQTNQFVNTVAEAGGWFAVPSVTVDPLNPGSEWHAPLPTGSDRDTPYVSGVFSDGKSRVGYTRLEEWAYEQHLFVTTEQPVIVNPGDPVFADDFDYVIARTATPTQLQAGFRAAGWNDARAENGTGRNTSYLYTVNSIAGFAGTFPAGARALAMEGYPNNGNDPSFLQADYWVQYGNEGGSALTIPANCWIQFWIYLQNFGTQLSRYPNRNKFLYPVADFFPGNSNPSSTVTVPWLVLLGAQGYEDAFGPLAENFIGVQAFGSNRGDGSDRLYQNVSSAKKLTANAWHLVKLRLDTSTAAGNVQAWIRTQGDANFTQIMDWRHGITPGFSWVTYPETRNGMKLLRMPTTENANPVNNPLRNGDGTNFKFMQSFALAGSEADLPTY